MHAMLREAFRAGGARPEGRAARARMAESKPGSSPAMTGNAVGAHYGKVPKVVRDTDA